MSIFHAMVVRVDRAPFTSVVVGMLITLVIAGRERVPSTSWRFRAARVLSIILPKNWR
jgi:hypothetical protein